MRLGALSRTCQQAAGLIPAVLTAGVKPAARWGVLAIIVCLPVFVSAHEGNADLTKAEGITVPFEMLKTQHMVVMIKVNGKGPYRVVFDTGAPVTLLNNKVATEAGIFPKNFKKPPLALFGSMGQFKIQTLEVGAAKAENMPTMVMDHPTVDALARALGMPIEGIVGFSFFAKFRTTIDYQKKEMTFVPNNYQPGDMMQNMMRMLMAARDAKKVIAPAGQWGLRVGKATDDMEAGVDVKEVMAGSSAAAAGLRPGDRLLTLDGRWTDTVGDCYAAASRVKPGTEAILAVRRDGKALELTVTVKSGL